MSDQQALQQALEQALAALAAAADQGRWESALAAGAVVREVLVRLVTSQPDLPGDFWVRPEDQDRFARAATLAIDAGRLDVAAGIIAAGPDQTFGAEFEAVRAAVQALRAGDLELTLATDRKSVV